MEFQIAAVDPGDSSSFRFWYETFTAALAADRPDPPRFTYEESHGDISSSDSYRRKHAFLLWCGEAPVGAGKADLPLRDNPRLLAFRLAVRPEYRRRGAGRALLSHVRALAYAERRTSLLTELDVPMDTPASAPGVRFAATMGFTLRNVEVRRQLRLPVPEALLERLRKAVTDPAYDIVGWAGPCPAQFADQYARLRGRLMAEAPTGSLAYETERWDVGRLRQEEARNDRQGRTLSTVVAVAPDGSLAGHTVMALPVLGDRAYQEDTLVLPEHRGRRLGLALKAANLHRVQAAHHGISRVETTNAEQNGPMVSINVALGFRPLELCQAWQRRA